MINTSSDIATVPLLALGPGIAEQDRLFLDSHYVLDKSAEWQLNRIDDCYQLIHQEKKLSLSLDFRAGNYRHRNKNVGKEPLLNAIKIKGKLPKTLLDATPGVLKDSVMLASRGIRVTAVERNPLLFVMVRQALSLVNLGIDYHFADSKALLPQLSAEIIYLDPMYPTKKKSAQVKKDMQVLHDLVGADADAEKLLSIARQSQARVVVKRPSYADYLGGESPNFSSQSQKRGATRFDVYLPFEANT